MTVKEYTEAKLKELQKKEAKDAVRKPAADTQEDRALVSKFYTALASGDRNALSDVNALIEKDWKAKLEASGRTKAQTEGTIGSGTAGGILVPTTVADSIISKMKYISPIRQISTVIDNMPAQLQLPSENSIAQAYWVGEATAITESGEVFDPNLLTPFKAAGLDSFSSEIIADAATNPSLQNYVEQRFAVALALLENAAFTSGDGSAKPYGFRSSAITPGSVAQAGAALTYSDCTKLKYTLPTAYRGMGVYVTSGSGVQALENIRDTQGRPIFRDGLADGTPATLLGRPLYVVDEIPTNLGAGTNATELWFGVFTNYFIGDRGGLRVDYGTQGTDFAADKISLRVAKRVAGKPVIGESFAKLTGVITS